MPAVTIICAVYNHEAYLSQAIESVLAQTFQDWELLLWDDGSQDNSVTLCRAYAERFPEKIRFFRHYGGVNQGQEKTRNAAIQKAEGKFLCLLDSDDYYHPEKLELLIEKMQDPEVGLAYGLAQRLDQETGAIETILEAEFPEGNPDEVLEKLLRYNFISAGAVLFRKTCFDQTRGFDSRFKAIGEYPLWIEIARLHKIAHVHKPVCVWRSHDSNTGLLYQVRAKQELLELVQTLLSDANFKAFAQALLPEVICQRTYDYASVLYEAHRFKEAENEYEKFLSLYEKLEKTNVPSHSSIHRGLATKAAMIKKLLILGPVPNKFFSKLKGKMWKLKKDILTQRKL